MSGGNENTDGLKKKQKERDASVYDYQYIEGLSEGILAQLQSANEEGIYVINDGSLYKLKPEDTEMINEDTKIVSYDKDGNIYYGSCSVFKEAEEDEDGNLLTNYRVEKQGEGVLYDKYGKIMYKGLFLNNERYIGINWNNKERTPILFKNKNNVSPKHHNDDEAFISFAHNVAIGESGSNTSIEEHDIIAKKYNKSFLYNLVNLDNENDYEEKINDSMNADGNDYSNVKIFNFRLSDHGGENVIRTNYVDQNGRLLEVQEDKSNKTSSARMSPIVNAIMNTIRRSEQNPIVIKLKLQQCSGATRGQDNWDIIEKLTTEIRKECQDSGKEISLYIEKGKPNQKMFTYRRNYADKTEGIGTSSTMDKVYIKYSNGDNPYTFETKNDYNNAFADEKAKIGVAEQRLNLSGINNEAIIEEKKAQTLIRPNQRENRINDYAIEKLPELNREKIQDANKEIKAQRTKYKEEKEVDMSEFRISTMDKIIIGCLCVVFPLAILYYENLKKNFIMETKKKHLQQSAGLRNLNDTNQPKRVETI